MTETDITSIPNINVGEEDRKILAGMDQREAVSDWIAATTKLQGSILEWWQAWARVITMRSN